MIRLLIFTCIFASLSFAKPTIRDFEACFKKNSNAFVYLNGVNALALSKDKAVATNLKRPTKYIKYDPYLKLYLLSSKKELNPIKMTSEFRLIKNEWLGSISPKKIKISKFKSYSDGVTPYDKLTKDGLKGGMTTGTCSEMYGLSVGNAKFIGNRYLKHFMAYNDVYYGDVGVRFGIKNSSIVVLHVNPFSLQRGFRAGDEILSVNGQNIESFRHLREKVLFAKKGSSLNFVVKRDGKRKSVKAKVEPWNLANKYTETFLENYGIIFDKNLNITNIRKNSKASSLGLKIGDSLLEINRKKIKSPKEVRVAISDPTISVFNFLFERNKFQFFVKIMH